MVKITGTHIIGDLYDCDFDFFLYLENFFKQTVLNFGLNIIGSMIYKFDNNSFSLNIMLMESHLCIHTWPEICYTSIDLFVCNYSKDNTIIANELFEELCYFFKSSDQKRQIIKR